jgi:hypothetical protein
MAAMAAGCLIRTQERQMPWLDYLAYFFGGVFSANTIPHLTNGISGRPFQSPFSRPPGQGLSSSLLNVIWAVVNLIIAYLLVLRVGNFDLRDTADIVVFGLGFAAMAIALSRAFGRFHGGNI